MELLIRNPNNLKLDGFCEWLKIYSFNYLSNTLNPDKLTIIDEYINNNLDIKFIDKRKRIIKSKSILLSAMSNLITTKLGDNYKINLDPNSNLPNSYAKFIDIVKLINYGNMQLNSYPIVTNTFNYIADNLNELYVEFKNRGGN